MKELEIGKIAEVEELGIKVQCLEADLANFIGDCSDCYINSRFTCEPFCCMPEDRSDGKLVYFKIVE